MEPVPEHSNSSAPALDCTLSPNHRHELLEDSALLPEIVYERGYRSITDPAELIALVFAGYQARVPGLLIPLYDTYGRNGHYVYKPDHPRPGGAKYEHPTGTRTILDVPLHCQATLLNPTVDLWVTEGSKKADALTGAGKCAIALMGVGTGSATANHWPIGSRCCPLLTAAACSSVSTAMQ
jgi:Domain of unknown function (DUF3854)